MKRIALCWVMLLFCTCITQYQKNMQGHVYNNFALASMSNYSIKDVSNEIKQTEESLLKDINFPKHTFFGAITLIRLDEINHIFAMAKDINNRNPNMPLVILTEILGFTYDNNYDIKTYRVLDYLDENFKDDVRDRNRENDLTDQKCDIIEYKCLEKDSDGNYIDDKVDKDKKIDKFEHLHLFNGVECYRGKFKNFILRIEKDDINCFYKLTITKYFNAILFDIPLYVTRDFWQFYYSPNIETPTPTYLYDDKSINNIFNTNANALPSLTYKVAYAYSFFVNNTDILTWTDFPIHNNEVAQFANHWNRYELGCNYDNIRGAELLLRSIQEYTGYMPVSMLSIVASLAIYFASIYVSDKYAKNIYSKIPYIGKYLYGFSSNKVARLVNWSYLSIVIVVPSYLFPIVFYKIPAKMGAMCYTRYITKKRINTYLNKMLYLDGWLAGFKNP